MRSGSRRLLALAGRRSWRLVRVHYPVAAASTSPHAVQQSPGESCLRLSLRDEEERLAIDRRIDATSSIAVAMALCVATGVESATPSHSRPDGAYAVASPVPAASLTRPRPDAAGRTDRARVVGVAAIQAWPRMVGARRAVRLASPPHRDAMRQESTPTTAPRQAHGPSNRARGAPWTSAQSATGGQRPRPRHELTPAGAPAVGQHNRRGTVAGRKRRDETPAPRTARRP